MDTKAIIEEELPKVYLFNVSLFFAILKEIGLPTLRFNVVNKILIYTL